MSPIDGGTGPLGWLLGILAVVGVIAITATVAGAVADRGDAADVVVDQERAARGLGERAEDPAGFAVWARNPDGTPVRWDPCTPIRWVLAPDGAPADAAEHVRTALGEISAATGISFVELGTTDERPSRDRDPYQPDRYGEDVWAPLLVAWARSNSGGIPMGANDRAVSIPVAVREGDERVFVSGQVVLNRDRVLRSGFTERNTDLGAVLMHEFAHAVGLDHVPDEDELLYPFPGAGPVRFGSGDLAGLEAVGAEGGCLTTPEPRPVDVEYTPDFGAEPG